MEGGRPNWFFPLPWYSLPPPAIAKDDVSYDALGDFEAGPSHAYPHEANQVYPRPGQVRLGSAPFGELIDDYQLGSDHKEFVRTWCLPRREMEEKEAAERRKEWERQQRQKKLEMRILDEQKAALKRNRLKRTK